MLKLLFKILQSFPAVKKLLSEYFAQERAELQAQIDGYEQGARIHIASIEGWAKRAGDAKAEAHRAVIEAAGLRDIIYARDAEVARLRLETEKKLADVDALDSESVFNASLSGAGSRRAYSSEADRYSSEWQRERLARSQDGAPLAERELPVDGGRR